MTTILSGTAVGAAGFTYGFVYFHMFPDTEFNVCELRAKHLNEPDPYFAPLKQHFWNSKHAPLCNESLTKNLLEKMGLEKGAEFLMERMPSFISRHLEKKTHVTVAFSFQQYAHWSVDLVFDSFPDLPTAAVLNSQYAEFVQVVNRTGESCLGIFEHGKALLDSFPSVSEWLSAKFNAETFMRNSDCFVGIVDFVRGFLSGLSDANATAVQYAKIFFVGLLVYVFVVFVIWPLPFVGTLVLFLLKWWLGSENAKDAADKAFARESARADAAERECAEAKAHEDAAFKVYADKCAQLQFAVQQWAKEKVRADTAEWKYNCEVVGVSPEASSDAIRKAYHKRSRKLHPDKGGNEDDFKKLNNAYEFLCKGDSNHQSSSQSYCPRISC